MRHQTELLEVMPAERGSRLDPARLPVSFNSPDSAANDGERKVTLESDRVIMARRLGAVAMKIALPLNAYRGVAIRIIPGLTEEEDRVGVILSHSDPALEVPLFEADDDENVIAEWRLWANTLGLPLLMEGVDGHTIATANRLGEVEVERPRPRRRHSLLSSRRPRFLSRRRASQLPMVPFVHRDEREIIAAE